MADDKKKNVPLPRGAESPPHTAESPPHTTEGTPTPHFDKVGDHMKVEPGMPQPVSSKRPPDVEQGFVAFNLDLYQLTELYGNIRDGNYWSAFRVAVDILHSNFTFDPRAVRGTPTQRVAMARRTPVSKVQVEEVKEKLEECCDNLEKQHGHQLKVSDKPSAPGASQEKNVGKVDFAGLIALVRMILKLFNP